MNIRVSVQLQAEDSDKEIEDTQHPREGAHHAIQPRKADFFKYGLKHECRGCVRMPRSGRRQPWIELDASAPATAALVLLL